MISIKIKNITFSLIASSLLLACGGENDENNRVENIDTTENKLQDTVDVTKNIKTVASNFPSPVDFVSHINQADIPYNEKVPNNISNADKYLDNSINTALNLGVYMADLGYNSLYFKASESLNYLKTTQKLSEQLNILNDKSKQLVARFEKNLDNRDSLLTITREAYFSLDEYLKGSERRDVASLVLAGSWIEGLYISTNALAGKENINENESTKVILWRIGGQKRSLNNLITILEKQSSEKKVKSILVKLKELQAIYNEVNVTEQADTSADDIIDIAEINDVNEITDQTVIKSIAKVDINEATFEQITQKIKEIRQEVVQP